MSNNVSVKHNGHEAATQSERTRGVTFTPRVDIVETPDELLLCADLPGVRPDAVDVHFENGELLLHARCPQRQSGISYLTAEYAVGDFYRAFTVSETIANDKISAELKNGVLTVHLPKSEAVKPRKIAVTGA